MGSIGSPALTATCATSCPTSRWVTPFASTAESVKVAVKVSLLFFSLTLKLAHTVPRPLKVRPLDGWTTDPVPSVVKVPQTSSPAGK